MSERVNWMGYEGSMSDADAHALLDICLTTSTNAKGIKDYFEQHLENFSAYSELQTLLRTGLKNHENDSNVPPEVRTEVETLEQNLLNSKGFPLYWDQRHVITQWINSKGSKSTRQGPTHITGVDKCSDSAPEWDTSKQRSSGKP